MKTRYMVVQQHTPKDRMFDVFETQVEAVEVFNKLSEIYRKHPSYFFLGVLSFEVLESTGKGTTVWTVQS